MILKTILVALIVSMICLALIIGYDLHLMKKNLRGMKEVTQNMIHYLKTDERIEHSCIDAYNPFKFFISYERQTSHVAEHRCAKE